MLTYQLDIHDFHSFDTAYMMYNNMFIPNPIFPEVLQQ